MRLFVVCLLGLFAACGEAPPTPTGDVRIGTGARDGRPGFVPFAPGAQLELAPGAQGGFHVFVNLELPAGAESLYTDRPLIRRVARRTADGVLVSRTTRREALMTGATDTLQTPSSLLLFLCPTPLGVSVAEEELELEVEVRHPSGAPSASGATRFVPICPDGPQASFCRSICYG
jgi:hypothetical protein